MSLSVPAQPTTALPGDTHPVAARTPANRASSLLSSVIARAFADDREYQRYAHSPASADPSALQDFVFATDHSPADPTDIFHRLRWGGQFVFASRSARRAAATARKFRSDGFRIERPVSTLRQPWSILPFFSNKIHYFAARKVQLLRPGEFTDRFTFQVELVPDPHSRTDEYVVLKSVPTLESVVTRLRRKFPDTPIEGIEKRARKFTERVFPTFLTREAAILKILQEHLPSRYAHRVPHVIELEKDIRGFVTSFKMNWLRNGGRPLSQLEFAMQSMDLLQAVHETAGILHLDLRLDNMVITNEGAGFVDFGSAVRVNENLSTNPMLDGLFDELMRTSHIQRMLFQMTKSGQVTAQHLCSQHGKADKAIDLFYLALQFTTPHANPDLTSLIHYDPNSEMAKQITALSKTVLRPGDPGDTTHKSAKDILRSLELIERNLKRNRGG